MNREASRAVALQELARPHGGYAAIVEICGFNDYLLIVVARGPVQMDGRQADWSGLPIRAVEKDDQHQAIEPDRRAVGPTDTRSGCVEAAAAEAKQGCYDLGQRTGATRTYRC